MGKSLIITGANFSVNAIGKVPYSYSETVSLTAGIPSSVSCALKSGKTYAIYIDGKLAANTLSISQSNTVLSRFQLSDHSNVRSNNSGTVFTASNDGSIDITATVTGTYTIHICSAYYIMNDVVSYGSGETIMQLSSGNKYFVTISNVQLSATATVLCPYLVYNNTNYGVFQGSETIDVGGYYIEASTTGNLTVGRGVPSSIVSYKVTIYSL